MSASQQPIPSAAGQQPAGLQSASHQSGDGDRFEREIHAGVFSDQQTGALPGALPGALVDALRIRRAQRRSTIGAGAIASLALCASVLIAILGIEVSSNIADPQSFVAPAPAPTIVSLPDMTDAQLADFARRPAWILGGQAGPTPPEQSTTGRPGMIEAAGFGGRPLLIDPMSGAGRGSL